MYQPRRLPSELQPRCIAVAEAEPLPTVVYRDVDKPASIAQHSAAQVSQRISSRANQLDSHALTRACRLALIRVGASSTLFPDMGYGTRASSASSRVSAASLPWQRLRAHACALRSQQEVFTTPRSPPDSSSHVGKSRPIKSTTAHRRLSNNHTSRRPSFQPDFARSMPDGAHQHHPSSQLMRARSASTAAIADDDLDLGELSPGSKVKGQTYTCEVCHKVCHSSARSQEMLLLLTLCVRPAPPSA